MNRSCIAIGLACLLSHALSTAAPAERRPNVLLILCDHLRCNALGCAGHPYLQTPNIDRLADESVFFENAFSTTSLCSPMRRQFSPSAISCNN